MRDSWLIGSIPDYVQAFGPKIGALELYLDEIESRTWKTPGLVLQTASARTGVWEDGLLTFYRCQISLEK